MKAAANGAIIFLMLVFLILFSAILKPTEKSQVEIKDFYCTGSAACIPSNCKEPYINPAMRVITNGNATCRFSEFQESYASMKKNMIVDPETLSPSQQHFAWGEKIPWNVQKKFFVSCVDSAGVKASRGMWAIFTSTLKDGNCDVVGEGTFLD